MDASLKKQIKSYVIDFLKARIPEFQTQKNGGLFTCPYCKKVAANVYPPTSGKVHCFTPECGNLGDIFDLCRKMDFDGQDIPDDELADLLVQEFNIQTNNKIEAMLQKYEAWGWSLVPVRANTKIADIEKDWQKKEHKNISEWRDWLKSGLNFGINGGEISNITIIDIDTKKVPQELQPYLDTTLMQTTPKGYHLFWKYDPTLPTVNLRSKSGGDLPVEIRSNGSQTVIYPSIVEGKDRFFNDKEIQPMPEGLKIWLNQFITPNDAKIETSINEDIKPNAQINEADFTFEKLNGNRNNTFLQFGGILRKYHPIKEVERIMNLVNNAFIDKALPQKEIKAMIRELGKYGSADINLIQKNVLEYLQKHEEATSRDLVECVKAERKDIQEALAQLIQEQKVYKQKTLYKAIKDVEWKSTFIDDIKTLSYQIPYFDSYAQFREGDQIVIGGNPGTGKTHLAMNFVRKFVEQGITPYYYGTESKSRYLQIALELGLKEGDFFWATGYEPSKIELKDNSVTIIDWLDIAEFSETAQIYKLLQKQLDKHSGILIVFSQLNNGDVFYAENQLKFYCSLAAKYLYTKVNGILDTNNTYFKVEKVRESKTGHQYFTIPTKFDSSTKTVELRKT